MISLAHLRAVEGQHVIVTLNNGTRMPDCRVVSVGRLWTQTVWLLDGDNDVFVRADEIEEVFVQEHREAA